MDPHNNHDDNPQWRILEMVLGIAVDKVKANNQDTPTGGARMLIHFSREGKRNVIRVVGGGE